MSINHIVNKELGPSMLGKWNAVIDWANSSTTSIATLQSQMSTAQGNISTLQSAVSAAQTNITNLQADVSAAESNISTLQTNVSNNTIAISTKQTGSAISTLLYSIVTVTASTDYVIAPTTGNNAVIMLSTTAGGKLVVLDGAASLVAGQSFYLYNSAGSTQSYTISATNGFSVTYANSLTSTIAAGKSAFFVILTSLTALRVS